MAPSYFAYDYYNNDGDVALGHIAYDGVLGHIAYDGVLGHIAYDGVDLQTDNHVDDYLH
jgi:hypothetical protein